MAAAMPEKVSKLTKQKVLLSVCCLEPELLYPLIQGLAAARGGLQGRMLLSEA